MLLMTASIVTIATDSGETLQKKFLRITKQPRCASVPLKERDFGAYWNHTRTKKSAKTEQ